MSLSQLLLGEGRVHPGQVASVSKGTQERKPRVTTEHRMNMQATHKKVPAGIRTRALSLWYKSANPCATKQLSYELMLFNN